MFTRFSARGLFVISALLVAVVVALFVGAGLKLSTMSLKASNTASRRALFAAESGLRYVQACQAEDYTWSADRGLVVDTADMVVREDNGNIVGILRTEGGDFAQFRVRFNFQDDSGDDVDGRVDPASLSIDSIYVSVQNILGGSPRSVPRGDGPDWSVTASSLRPYKVPAGSTCVIVEGRYGPGLSGLSASNLNPAPNGKLTARVLEAYFEAPAPPGGDSAGQAAGNMEFEVEGTESVSLTSKTSNEASRIRSRAEISVQGGGSPNLVSESGETYTVDGSLNADPDSNTQTYTEDASQDFLSIGWDEVKKATTSDATLDAGVYVMWDDGSLHYYDMSYDDFSQHTEANPTDAGTVVGPGDLPDGMSMDLTDPSNPRLVIEKNILITGTTQTDEFTIIPRKGAQEDPPDAAGDLAGMAASVEKVLPAGTPGGSVGDATKFDNPPGIPGIDQEFDGSSFYVKLHGDHFHIRDNANPTVNVPLSQAEVAALLSDPTLSPPDQAMAEQILRALGGIPEAMGEFDLGSIEPTLRADNLTVSFEPPEGESAILSATGDVRLGTNVEAVGGAITSEGDIRLIGHGASFDASEENGLALYAKGDVVVSSLKEVPIGSGNWEYKDVDFKGVMYSWADINAKLSNDDPAVSRHGDFFAQGALVAYGGDPNGAPGANGKGAISMDANSVELKYDPIYILQLGHLPPSGPLLQTLYNSY